MRSAEPVTCAMHPNPLLTAAEYFAGIGLMRLGLEQGGWTTVFATMAYIIKPEILCDLINTGRKALSGISNDDEHDALYEIVTTLESLQTETDDNNKSKCPNVKSL